jgi:membrane fusion protein
VSTPRWAVPLSTDRLFRQEALDAQATQWLGSIRLAQPIGHVVAAALGLIVIALIAAFAFFGSYTKRATVTGSLEPIGGTLRLTTPSAGVIAGVRVVEGQRVAAGDVLFVLSGERRSSSGATQALIGAQMEARRAALERDRRLVDQRRDARLHVTRERLAAIDVELVQLEHEADINRARETIAQKNVERFDELARTGFVAPTQAQARLDDALVIRAQRENYKRVQANLQRERVGLVSQLEESRLQADGEAIDIARNLAALEQERSENEARRSTVVTAPHAATVTGIAARAGQLIAGGGLLATLIPEGAQLEAQLFASTRQIGFVERGQRVHLRFAAYPYQKFGMGSGVVDAIEKSPYAPQELSTQVIASLGSMTLQTNEPLYRIVVALDEQTIATYGRAQTLRPGMLFEADVIQDRRKLYEWLLEPIYGLAGR